MLYFNQDGFNDSEKLEKTATKLVKGKIKIPQLTQVSPFGKIQANKTNSKPINNVGLLLS